MKKEGKRKERGGKRRVRGEEEERGKRTFDVLTPVSFGTREFISCRSERGGEENRKKEKERKGESEKGKEKKTTSWLLHGLDHLN